MNINIKDNINRRTTEIEGILDLVDVQTGSLIEEMFETKFDKDYIDTVIKIRKKYIPQITYLLSEIDDEADDIETECYECTSREIDDEDTYEFVINANEEIQWTATNFHDKQVMEKLSELYTDGATSLQLLDYLNKHTK